jgi:hypothetical protein
MNEQEKIDQQNNVKDVLNKKLPLTAVDLQILRESAGIVAYLTSHHDPLAWRMEIEHLDSIRRLDETSSKLATIGIVVAGVAAAGTIAGVLIALLN